jgi:hypothetical protein
MLEMWQDHVFYGPGSRLQMRKMWLQIKKTDESPTNRKARLGGKTIHNIVTFTETLDQAVKTIRTGENA